MTNENTKKKTVEKKFFTYERKESIRRTASHMLLSLFSGACFAAGGFLATRIASGNKTKLPLRATDKNVVPLQNKKVMNG